MPSVYSGPSSGGRSGSVYSGPNRRKTRSKRKSRGISDAEYEFWKKNRDKGSFFERIADDVRSATLGTPGFFKGAIESTVKDVAAEPWSLLAGPAAPLWAMGSRRGKSELYKNVYKPIGQNYVHTYGPALPFTKGGVGTTLGRMNEHPLFSALDMTALASGGTSAAVKLGVLKPAARTAALKLPSGEQITRPVVGTELSRRMRLGAQKALNRLPADMKVLGEHVRAAKYQQRDSMRGFHNLRAQLGPYETAVGKLSTNERVALSLREDLVTPENVAVEVAHLRSLGDKTSLRQAALFSRPKVLALVKQPSKKMQAALELGDDVRALRESLIPEGNLGEAALAQRPWLPLLRHRGVTFEHAPLDVSLGDKLLGKKVVLDGREGALIKLDGNEATVRFGVTKNGKRATYTKTVALDDLRSTHKEMTPPPGKTIEGLIAEIRAGLPEGVEPKYRPEVMERPKGGAGTGPGAGGRVPQASPVRQNRSLLWAAGRIARDFDTLGPATQRLFRWALYNDKHAALVRGAKELAPGEHAPQGWEYVKQKRGERVGHIAQHEGSFEADLAKLVDLEDPGVSALGKELTTLDSAEAAVGAGGGKLVVPKNYSKRLIGEFELSDNVIAKFYRNTTDVWRALVLNLRIGYLVNNVVGNTMLFTFKSAGIGGLRAYWDYVLATKGQKAAREMFADAGVRRTLSDKTLAEHFGDQVLGTFQHGEVPVGLVAKVLNSRYSPTRPIRRADQIYEGKIRKALVDVYLRRSPEVRAFYGKMEGQTRNFDWAARQALDANPDLAARTSQLVNDALGDYMNMTAVERKVLRGVFPFYAWYRAITTVMAKMPFDSPYRTVILANMSRVGMEWTDDVGLPWLEGAIPFGESILGTAGMNPYSTPYSLGRGAFADDWFAQQQRLGLFNPWLQASYDAYADRSLRPFYDEVRGLPQARLAFPESRASYEGNNRLREFYAFLGIPFKKPANR